MKRWLLALTVLLLAAPAGASWTTTVEPPEAELQTATTSRQTFTTTVGDLAALNISSCSQPITVDFDASVADGSADATVLLYSCTSITTTSNVSECRSVPVLDDNNQPLLQYTGRGISAPGPYLIPKAKTPTVGGDTAQLSVHCTSTGMGSVSSASELVVADCESITVPAGSSCYDETEGTRKYCPSTGSDCELGLGLVSEAQATVAFLEGNEDPTELVACDPPHPSCVYLNKASHTAWFTAENGVDDWFAAGSGPFTLDGVSQLPSGYNDAVIVDTCIKSPCTGDDTYGGPTTFWTGATSANFVSTSDNVWGTFWNAKHGSTNDADSNDHLWYAHQTFEASYDSQSPKIPEDIWLEWNWGVQHLDPSTGLQDANSYYRPLMIIADIGPQGKGPGQTTMIATAAPALYGGDKQMMFYATPGAIGFGGGATTDGTPTYQVDINPPLPRRVVSDTASSAGAGDGSTLVDTSHTWIDDEFNASPSGSINYALFIKSSTSLGSAAPVGQYREITDMVSSTGTITVSPVFSAQVPSDAVYYIVSMPKTAGLSVDSRSMAFPLRASQYNAFQIDSRQDAATFDGVAVDSIVGGIAGSKITTGISGTGDINMVSAPEYGLWLNHELTTTSTTADSGASYGIRIDDTLTGNLGSTPPGGNYGDRWGIYLASPSALGTNKNYNSKYGIFIADQKGYGTSGYASAIDIATQTAAANSGFKNNLRFEAGTWTGGHVMFGTTTVGAHLYLDATDADLGWLRVMQGTAGGSDYPTSATSGNIVVTGSQSNSHGVTMWGDVDITADNTGDKVCAHNGLTCVMAYELVGTEVACNGTPTGTTPSHFYGVLCK